MIFFRLSSSSRLLFLQSLAKESHRSIGIIDLTLLKPEVILTTKNRNSCVQKLKIFKASREKKAAHVSEAAVLVPLVMHEGELGFLYTLRSTKLSSNRGQVSFPGGMKDEGDSCYEETAIRETWEELRINKDKVEIWGSGNLLERKNVSVMPVLGYLGELDLEQLELNKEEVEEAFVLPLKHLCDPKHCRYTQFKNNYTLPTYIGGKHRIWGLTAIITHIILSSLVPEVYNHKLHFIKPILKESNKNNSFSVTTTKGKQFKRNSEA